ncbi:hypothetical protein D3C84_385440 [compost metagenome]
MQTFGDQAIAGLQAVFDQPLVADGAAGLELTQFDLVVRADDQRGRCAFEVTGHALLRGQDRRAVHTSLQLRVDEHARQQGVVRVGEHGAQGHGTGGLVNRDFGELQLALLLVLAAVLKGQLDHGGVIASLLQATAFQLTAQFEQFDRGLGDVDVDRVQLLDHGHGVGLAIVYQRPFGNAGAANAAGQRCQHLGVAQVDLGRLQGGFRLQAVGHGGVVFLTAHGLLVDQLFVAIGNRLGRLQVGLRTGQGRLIDRRVDLVELLAFLDVAAFLEQTLENDAIDLWANFRDAVGRGATRQFGGQGKGLGFKGNDTDQRGLRGRGRLFLFTSAEQGCQGDGSDQSGNSWLELHEDPRVRRAKSAQEVWKGKKWVSGG